MGCCPGRGRQSRELPVGRRRQTREHILQVTKRIDPVRAAALDDRVHDRAALARLGMRDKQPALLPERCRPNLTRIFHTRA